MKPPDRDEAPKAFRDNLRVKVMFVSLEAGNSSLNLVAAQHVLVVKPD